MSETRTGKRFDLKLPISIEASDSANKLEGLTDNLSAAGVFMHADASLKVGSKVNFEIVLPREAMGLGDVKFMGAIGAFLGWPAVIFSLAISSLIGAVVGLTLVISGKRALSSRLPYGPYIALAATLWIFAGHDLVAWYVGLVLRMTGHG